MRQRLDRQVWLAVLVFGGYYIGGRIGLSVPFTSGNVSPIWPSSGIALAAFLVLGSKVWPAVALAALLVNIFTPIPHLSALGIAAGDTAGPLAGAWLLRRLPGFQPSLARLRDVIALVLAGALAGPAISATAGAVALSLAGVNAWTGAGSAWLIWWFGDGMGVLIVAPVILTARRLLAERGLTRLLELAALVAGAVVACALVFGRLPGFGLRVVLVLVMFPFVMWGAIRFEAPGAGLVTFFVSAIAIWRTAHGHGLFMAGTPIENATLLQSFLAVVAVSGLAVATLVAERTALVHERAEREGARRAEARFRHIAETANEGVWMLDANLLTCYVNRRMASMLGYAAGEMLDRPVTAFMFQEDVAAKRVELERRRRGVSEEVENRYRRRDGSELWVRVNTTASLDWRGRFTGALAMVSDITEQRRRDAESALARDTILLLSRAVEQTADSIIVTDRDGVIEYVNPAFEETTGYARDEAVGRTPAILKSGRHDRAFYANLWAELLDGRTFSGTLVNRKRGGELYWAEQTITPVKDGEGAITHFVSVLKDVTELRKRQEQEVQLRLARQVQQQFYREPVPIPGLDIAAASYPANETGGDYFDVIAASPESVYLAIGDASGHGFPSALVMALTRAYVRSLAALNLEVGEILARVNTMLRSDLEDNRFVTLLLARIDPRRRILSYANAGHVSGFIVDGRRGLDCEMASTGPPVGVFEHTQFSCSQLPLDTSKVILMVTDGVVESASDGDHEFEFGADRLISYACDNCTRPARHIADGICQAARSFADGEQADDITSLVVKVGN